MEAPQHDHNAQLDRLHAKVGTLAENLLDCRPEPGEEDQDVLRNIASMRMMGANLGLQLLKQSGWSAPATNKTLRSVAAAIPDRAALEKLMELTPPD